MSCTPLSARLSLGFALGLLSIFAIIGNPLVSSAFAQAKAIGDYDGDGRSDFAVANVSKSIGNTIYTIRHASGATKSLEFKLPADVVAPGRYFSANLESPAIVYVRSAFSPLEWNAFTSDGALRYINYGNPGDYIVPADYDCDGVTDVSVARVSGEFFQWDVGQSRDGVLKSYRFGAAGARIFGADADGDGCAEAFAVTVEKGTIVWKYRKLADGAATVTANWGLEGDIPLRPLDMNRDGRPDLIVVRLGSTQNTAYVKFGEGSTTSVALPTGTVTLTGNFTGQNGFASFHQASGTVYVRQANGSDQPIAFGNATGVIVRPDGSTVPTGYDERLFGASSSGGGSSGNSGNIRCDRKLKRNDGHSGFVHNPHNSRKTIKVILPSSFTYQTRGVWVLKKGKVLEQLRLGGFEYGGRQRYYGKKSPSKYPKNLVVLAETNTGTQYCVTIPKPTQRYD